MKKAEKIAETKAVLAEAQRVGCDIRLSESGDFVLFKPPLDVEWTRRASKVAEQIKAMLLA